MEIDPAEVGNVKQARGNNLPVGDDDDGVRLGLAQELLGFGRADFLRLENGNFIGDCSLLYRREGDFVAAAAPAVWLGNDGTDMKIRLRQKVFEAGDSKGWSATEYEAYSRGGIGKFGRAHLLRSFVPIIRTQDDKFGRSRKRGCTDVCGHRTGALQKAPWLPLALLFEFFDFALDEVALEHAEVL